ncbi:hypothetical protein TWF506_000461 [Arthrobotrys conoides]|uniref:Uncharacterized protein n=1 Tax=Arthrobotrys conoides TaxID=74498 RepID=A0AAN8NFQ8_9PEZI
MVLQSGRYHIISLANQKRVGLHVNDPMIPGDQCKQVFADDITDPMWSFEDVGDGRYLIKTTDMDNICAGDQHHNLCAFGEGYPLALGTGENGPCEWAVEEDDQGCDIYRIHKVNSREGWTVEGNKVSIAYSNNADEEKFMIMPVLG